MLGDGKLNMFPWLDKHVSQQQTRKHYRDLLEMVSSTWFVPCYSITETAEWLVMVSDAMKTIQVSRGYCWGLIPRKNY
jgi:hypothetical protein